MMNASDRWRIGERAWTCDEAGVLGRHQLVTIEEDRAMLSGSDLEYGGEKGDSYSRKFAMSVNSAYWPYDRIHKTAADAVRAAMAVNEAARAKMVARLATVDPEGAWR